MSKKTLVLSRREVEKLINMRRVLTLVEKAFIAQAEGRVQMPAKIYIHLEKYHGDFRAMPAYIQGMEACGIKWVNVHPENKKYGLPSIMAVIILSEPKTGFPLAIMDGTLITNLRTGAAGGIAAKYLANKNSSRVALVGCGKQAQAQLIALNKVSRIKNVLLYDNKRFNAIAFAKKMKYLGFKMKLCANIKECVKEADIVVTTTPSRKPIIKAAWIKKGTHINAIGADARGKEELDPAILKVARIIVDDKTQAMHSGEINVPITKRIIKEKDICGTLGEVIIGKKKGRLNKSDITIFDSTGLAIHDVAVANFVYLEAIKKRLGKFIVLT